MSPTWRVPSHLFRSSSASFLCELQAVRRRCFALCESSSGENWWITAPEIMRRCCVRRACVYVFVVFAPVSVYVFVSVSFSVFVFVSVYVFVSVFVIVSGFCWTLSYFRWSIRCLCFIGRRIRHENCYWIRPYFLHLGVIHCCVGTVADDG